MTSRFPPFAFVELVRPYNKKNITRCDMTANPACHVIIIIQWLFPDGMIRLDSHVQRASVTWNT